jgi:hypothetical protein
MVTDKKGLGRHWLDEINLGSAVAAFMEKWQGLMIGVTPSPSTAPRLR